MLDGILNAVRDRLRKPEPRPTALPAPAPAPAATPTPAPTQGQASAKPGLPSPVAANAPIAASTTAAPAQTPETPAIAPDRRAAIDSWVRDNATHESGGLFWDSKGGTLSGKALRGESPLGALTTEERDELARQVVGQWMGQERGRSTENVAEAADEVRHDPTARAALARALAQPEMSAQAVYAQGGAIMSAPDSGAKRSAMLQAALRMDAAAVVRANPGLEPQLASVASATNPALRADLWSVAADRGQLTPQQGERLSTALFMFEDGSGAAHPEGRARIADALANARVPGEGDAARIQREQIARNIAGALEDGDVRSMLFDQKTAPELRVWALGQVAGANGACHDVSAFKGGWESEAISTAYAAQVTDAYKARGTQPQVLNGEALRNIVGQSMGIAPDQLPQGEPSAEFLNAGLNNRFYSAGGTNEPIDTVAAKIAEIGGAEAKVTVVPVTVTSKDQGAATVPVFRVEDAASGEARFVDHTGRTYRDLADWEQNNTLPKGRMTYAEGLDLGRDTMTHRNTPGVVDTFAEGFGKVVDGVALGVGIVAAGALIVGSGGTATPLVAAGAAGLWAAGRAGQQLHDMHTHGQDIGDLSDPAVRANWLEVAAGVLSVAAIGGALRLGSAGSKASPLFARAVAGTAVTADVADGVTMADQSIHLARNWQNMSGADRAAGLLNIAFWGGMSMASRSAGGIARNGGDGLSFAGLDQRIRSGATVAPGNVPVEHAPNLAPGEVQLAFDTANGRATNIRIQHGPGTPDPARLALHEQTAAQLQASGGLRGKLDALLAGKPAPEVGSAALEARLDIDKINTEALAIAQASANATTPQQRGDLAIRQRELDQALIRAERRLDTPYARGNGFIAAPRSLTDMLGHYSSRGDITLGVPDSIAAIAAPSANAARRLDYGSMNAAGQALGIEATITRDMLNTGSSAKSKIKPPGWDSDNGNHSRGHLLAKMLGGSGSDPRNLVTLFQRDANSPVMRDFEQYVYDAVEAGEIVNYKVTPVYDGDGKPTSVALQAKGSQGLDIAITIINRDGR